MKFLQHIGLVLVLSFLTFISCTDEEIQADGIEPFITLKFINQDSLNKVRAVISANNSRITAIDKRIAAIDTADNRTELQAEKDSLNQVKSVLEDSTTYWVTIRTAISNGKVQVDSVAGISTGQYILFGNILSSYVLPVNSNSNFCSYSISLNTRTDTLDLSYIITTAFIENQLRATATNLDVSYSSYDSVIVNCKDTICNTNEAELTIYF